jgi:hypothetical protein
VLRDWGCVVAVRGPKPGRPGVGHNRNKPAHDWTEVEDVPFDDGPELPEYRPDGRPWPEATKVKWETWRSMPHAKLWGPAEWSYAVDAVCLAASFHDSGEARFATELRNRERVLGTTTEYRRDLRIRYVDAEDDNEVPAGVTRIRDYHRAL